MIVINYFKMIIILIAIIAVLFGPVYLTSKYKNKYGKLGTEVFRVKDVLQKEQPSGILEKSFSFGRSIMLKQVLIIDFCLILFLFIYVGLELEFYIFLFKLIIGLFLFASIFSCAIYLFTFRQNRYDLYSDGIKLSGGWSANILCVNEIFVNNDNFLWMGRGNKETYKKIKTTIPEIKFYPIHIITINKYLLIFSYGLDVFCLTIYAPEAFIQCLEIKYSELTKKNLIEVI